METEIPPSPGSPPLDPPSLDPSSSNLSSPSAFEEDDDYSQNLRNLCLLQDNEMLRMYVDYHLQSYPRVKSEIHGSVVASQKKAIKGLEITVQHLLPLMGEMYRLMQIVEGGRP
jgi:hypothetical protein